MARTRPTTRKTSTIVRAEVELATLHSPEDNDITRSQIADVKDMIADLEQRVSSDI